MFFIGLLFDYSYISDDQLKYDCTMVDNNTTDYS
jgi:hypothetical protein